MSAVYRLSFLLFCFLAGVGFLADSSDAKTDSSKRESASFDVIPKNPMGFTVYRGNVGNSSDSWSRVASMLTDTKRKQQPQDALYRDLFRYLCFKTKLERANLLELSQSSLNAKFCSSIVGEESADSKTLSELRRQLVEKISKLDAAEAVGFVDHLGGIYIEAPLYRFSEDPQFLMSEVSSLLEDVYEQNPLLYEKRKQDENKGFWGYAGDVADVGLFVSAGVTGHRLVNNVLFGEILQGGARSGPVTMLSLWLRKAAGKIHLASPVPDHRWETRVVNGNPKRVLVYEDSALNESAINCSSLFANLTRNLAIAAVWGASYYWLLHDEVKEFLMARSKVLGDSHPLETLSQAQVQSVSALSQQIEAQRAAFEAATDAATGGPESWKAFVEQTIIEEKMFRRAPPFDPALGDDVNVANISKAITDNDRKEMTNRFFALAQAWSVPDNTALVARTRAESDPALRITPSVVAIHRSLLRSIKEDAKQLSASTSEVKTESGAKAPAAPVNLTQAISSVETMLIGDGAAYVPVSSLATRFVDAFVQNIGLE